MMESSVTPDTERVALEQASDTPELVPVLDNLVREAEATLRQASDHWHREYGIQIVQPLRACMLAAVSQHRRLTTKAQEADSEDRLASAIGYRASVVKDVLKPIIIHLESLAASETMAGGRKAIAELEELAERTEKDCNVPCPASLFEARPGQTRPISRLIAKWRMGAARRLRALLGKPPKEVLRRVPLRALLRYHAVVRIAGTVAHVHEELEQYTAGLVGILETGLTDWTNALLDIEEELGGEGPSVSEAESAEASEQSQSGEQNAWPRAAKEFSDVLELALKRSIVPETNALTSFAENTDSLREDLCCAGTPLLREKDRKLPAKKTRERMLATRDRWAAWHSQALARLDLNVRSIRLHQNLVSAREQLLRQMGAITFKLVKEAFEPSASRLYEASEMFVGRKSGKGGRQELKDLRTKVLEPIREKLVEPIGQLAAEKVLSKPGDEQWTALLQDLDSWPDTIFLHALPKAEKAIVPGAVLERTSVKRDVQQMLEPLPDRLTDLARPLRRRLAEVWSHTERVVSIVEFSLGAALQELEVEATAESVENARELARGGLRRASRALTELLESFERQWNRFAEDTSEEFRREWADIHRGLRSEDYIEERWVNIQSKIRRRAQHLRRQLRTQTLNAQKLAGRFLRIGRHRAATLIEQGRTAMGTASAAESDRWAALEAIGPGAIRNLTEGLPLVYRRLYALEPVGEEWLLEGRDSDLAYLRQHVERWRSRVAIGALVLPMPLGSGRSSLLHVLESTLDKTENVTRVTLRHRYLDSTGFAREFGAAMGFEVSTLEELELKLRKAESRVCLVDNLEYLMRRAIYGAGLLEHVLLFMSRTDSKVCWIATVGALAWQYLDRAHGRATGLVSTYQAGAVNRKMLEAIMLNRHQRSGLHLHFIEPDTPSALLVRRLKRARAGDVRQDLLQDHYFERLHSRTGSNIMLAKLYWLQSAEFEEGRVKVRQWRRLNFRFLDFLDLTSYFSLKAFLMHDTLTLKEHAEVFNSVEAEASTVMASLFNLGLIVPSGLPVDGLDKVPNRIVPETRYRLHPLLLHPVRQVLRSQNIIH